MYICPFLVYNPASVSMLTRVGKETYLFLNKLEISVNKGIVLVNGEHYHEPVFPFWFTTKKASTPQLCVSMLIKMLTRAQKYKCVFRPENGF